MNTKTFNTINSNDLITTNYNTKTHIAYFQIKQIDKLTENIRLVKEIVNFLMNIDIKWIATNINFRFRIVQNMVWYKKKPSNIMHCHILDFEEFYLKNIANFINIQDIYVPENNNDDWITVTNTKKERAKKMKDIMNEIENMFPESKNNI